MWKPLYIETHETPNPFIGKTYFLQIQCYTPAQAAPFSESHDSPPDCRGFYLLSLDFKLSRGAGNRTRAARSQTVYTTIMLRPAMKKMIDARIDQPFEERGV